ncbi:hypothetical protein AAY77_12325 [Providencia rettgeri]|nr:hypothetical protein AAY77_12325 [Providencia rettgeri]
MMKQQWKWRQLVSITLFFFIISFSSSITALTSNNLPDKNEIKSALNALNKKSSLSEEDKLALADLEKTSDFYNELDKLEQRTAELQKKLNSVSEESKQAAQGLLQIKNENEQRTENFLRKIQDSSLSQLEALQASYLENLQTEQNDLATYSSQLIGLTDTA